MLDLLLELEWYMKENKETIGYYSVIPATVLYNKELKANEKLLYAIITSLACIPVSIKKWTGYPSESGR